MKRPFSALSVRPRAVVILASATLAPTVRTMTVQLSHAPAGS